MICEKVKTFNFQISIAESAISVADGVSTCLTAARLTIDNYNTKERLMLRPRGGQRSMYRAAYKLRKGCTEH